MSRQLVAAMDPPDWLHANDRRRPLPEQVKIREGVYVMQNMVKTPGGLVRITAVNDGGLLRDVHISGDFFFYPAADLPALEDSLNGVAADTTSVTRAVEIFYTRRSIESPGLKPADISKALVPAG